MKKLLDFYLLVVLFLLPLVFLPFFRDFFGLGKIFFLFPAVVLGLIIWFFSSYRKEKFVVVTSLFWWLFFLWNLFLGGWLFFLSRGNRYEALMGRGGVAYQWLLLGLAFLLEQSSLKKKRRQVIFALSLSGALLALIATVLFILPEGSFPLKLFQQRLVITDSFWNPWGGIWELVWFLFPLTVFLLAFLVRRINQKEKIVDWQFFPLILAILVGGVIVGYQLIEKKPPLLSWRFSWVIAVESFKHWPLFGIGPGLFVRAFSFYRPVAFNQSAWWTTRFIKSGNVFLHIWTELGILGLIILGAILGGILKTVRKENWEWKLFGWFLALGIIFLPITKTFFFWLVVLGALLTKKQEINLGFIGRKILGGVLLVLILTGGWFYQRALRGEALFYRFAMGIAQGKAKNGDYLKAERLLPMVTDFRLFRSQVDISLLKDIIAQNKGQELDEKTRQQITGLAQEAIGEAKAAAALEPKEVIVWRNLAQVYNQLIGIAQGADQWAIAAYQQAVAFDPLDPRLRLDLGGIYYLSGDYEQAQRQFETAVKLKTNYANGWYNLAWALKKQNKLQQAVEALQQTLFLVSPDSTDFQKAQKELDEWRKELGEKQAKEKAKREKGELQPPPASPSPAVSQPIELPQEAAPPVENQATPSANQ
ncbi:tetratricopeptide repeat protein [bacterium]|nr:tetratricopeptide repeat protein [bacterium]